MQYFGVPTCPYCKKRVNLIRTWSLKRQGEYRCPRCGGISNIYLSPCVRVRPGGGVCRGGHLLFPQVYSGRHHLTTGIQVVIPFAVFFLLSLFMVYLAKPVIKKVPRAQVDRKRRNKGNFEERRMPAGRQGQTGQIFYDGEDYQPQHQLPGRPHAPGAGGRGHEDCRAPGEPPRLRGDFGAAHSGGRPPGGDHQPECSGPGRGLPYPGSRPRPSGPTEADGTEPGPGPAGPARRPGGCPGQTRRSGEPCPACRPAPSLRAGAGTGPCRAPGRQRRRRSSGPPSPRCRRPSRPSPLPGRNSPKPRTISSPSTTTPSTSTAAWRS